jgi:hypothetical protein
VMPAGVAVFIVRSSRMAIPPRWFDDESITGWN